jgi:branched-chain amino acid transport system permease protein
MATSTTTSTSSSWRATLKQPLVVGVLLFVYLAVTLVILFTLNRSDLLFPVYSTCAFPLFVLSPFVVLASPLAGRAKVAVALFLMAIVMPILGIFDGAYLELVVQICIFASLALGLNIVVGFAGLLDLGYIAFFAVGAYLWAMFTSNVDTIFQINGWLVPAWTFYLFIFLGVIVAGIVGILLGLPVLRLRGDYLAIVTLGFGEMIRVLARNLDSPINFTNGSQGLSGVLPPPFPPLLPELTQFTIDTIGARADNLEPVVRQILFYFLGLIILGLFVLVARRLEDSPIGRAWTAIREDEVAAIAMGVPLVRMKLLAFAMGGAFSGAIGVLYAAKQTFVSPESFSLIQSISILAMVIVGGLGGIRGVILGAVVVTLLNLQVLKNFSLLVNSLRQMDYVIPIINFHVANWPTQLEPAKYERLVFGALLIIMMIFRPAGLLPEARRRLELQAAKEEATAPAVQPAGD